MLQDETRKLAAIVFTDIVGFSRQMGADEGRTLRLLEVHNQLLHQAVAEQHGTVIKTIGDAFLVDFSSVVNAVQCAQQIQARFRAYNAQHEVGEQMHLRIGVHSGDIVQKDGDVFGDGVNIAKRLQELTEPDTICLSDVVYRDVVKKLDLGTVVSLGRPQLKNIAERFQVYALLAEPPKGVRQKLQVQQLKFSRRVRPMHYLALVGLLVFLAGGITTLVVPSLSPFRIPHSEIRIQEALPLPDKPSIVIRPFANLSNDSSQDYFSNGITEDITADLSKISSLFVISPHTAALLKDTPLQEVSKELGIQYVLEGSVRRSDHQVRITVQLSDAVQDHLLWSERYDRELKDIFVLQDEIRQKIVFALKVKLTPEEQERFKSAQTDNLEAYDYYLRGGEYWFRETKDSFIQAQQLWMKAIELDEKFARAYAALSSATLTAWFFQWSSDPQTLEQGFTLGQRAAALDDSLSMAHRCLGLAYLFKKQHDQAVVEAERATLLDPNDAEAHVDLGWILSWVGRPGEAIGEMEKAMRLNPHHSSYYLALLGRAYRLAGRYEEAVTAYKKALARNPDFLGNHLGLAATYSEFGRETEAQAEAVEVLRINPQYSLEMAKQRFVFKDPAVLERELAALRKAGLK